MELYKVINKIIKYMERILIGLLLSSYFLLIVKCAVKDKNIITTYFILVSFAYYIRVLIKSPGSLLDYGNDTICGLCDICNRIKGSRTKHCQICNKCYNKRDHHNMLVGRCIAENNIFEMLMCNIFLLIFLIIWEITKNHDHLLIIPICGLLIFIGWMLVCVGQNRTTKEIGKYGNRKIEFKNYRILYENFKKEPIKSLFPFILQRSNIEY